MRISKRNGLDLNSLNCGKGFSKARGTAVCWSAGAAILIVAYHGETQEENVIKAKPSTDRVDVRLIRSRRWVVVEVYLFDG